MIGKEVIDRVEDKEEIKTEINEISADKLSAKESYDFWNRFFKGDSERTSDELLWNEMLYRDESEFDFSGIVDDNTQKILESFTAENWECLDKEERFELMKSLVEGISNCLGIEEIPDVELVELEDGCSGFFNERDNYIGINTNCWGDGKDVVDTIAHETRHAYQRFRADKLENGQDDIYIFNFEHYISPEQDEKGNFVNFLDYYEQYIEVEARAFAKEFALEVA